MIGAAMASRPLGKGRLTKTSDGHPRMSPSSDNDIALAPLQPEAFAHCRQNFMRDWAADHRAHRPEPPAVAMIPSTRRTDASLPEGVATKRGAPAIHAQHGVALSARQVGARNPGPPDSY